MKIIHCADLHLDSPMTSNLDRQKASERKNELLGTFSAMADYAEKEGVSAVIIAGDLFDRNRVSASARNIVYGVISSHSDVQFYYLRGNHDQKGGSTSQRNTPPNLQFFGPEWTSYELREGMAGGNRVTITGREINEARGPDTAGISVYEQLMPDARSINIVVLHGQLSSYASAARPGEIDLRRLSGRNIDYLALGHVHQYQKGPLPPGGMYCYPGCLEGRGFDETGEHGFVLLDINTRTRRIKDTFIPFAKRRLYEIDVEITDCLTTAEIAERILAVLKESSCRQNDMLKLILRGEVDVECEKNTDYLEQQFGDMFYYVRIDDQSRLAVDYREYELEISLKGELVRLVQEEPDLSEEEKAEIIRCALQALNEEEISL